MDFILLGVGISLGGRSYSMHIQTFTHMHMHSQPSTDVVVGAADGTGFFVNDRFVGFVGTYICRELGGYCQVDKGDTFLWLLCGELQAIIKMALFLHDLHCNTTYQYIVSEQASPLPPH